MKGAKKPRRAVIPPDQLSEEGNFLFKVVNEEPDLPCALIVTAFLERALTSLLGKFFVEGNTSKTMLAENGLLGEFAKCTDVAYCLGLISSGMLGNLKLIGRIRNLFAHSHQLLTFEHSEVKPMCLALTYPPMVGGVSLDTKNPGQPPTLEGFFAQFGDNPRIKFVLISIFLFQRLISDTISVEPRQKKEDGWQSPSTDSQAPPKPG